MIIHKDTKGDYEYVMIDILQYLVYAILMKQLYKCVKIWGVLLFYISRVKKNF